MTNKIFETPALSFTEAVKLAWSRLTQFRGRSRRSEYWWTILVATLASFVLGFIPFLGQIIGVIIGLATLPLTIRRLHDTGRSGWWVLGGVVLGVAFLCVTVLTTFSMAETNDISAFFNPLFVILICVMLIYDVVMLVFMCLDSDKTENKYGPSPKYIVKNSDVEIDETNPNSNPQEPTIP